MPLLRRRRVLAAKQETSVGSAEALTASEGAFNIFDAELQANIEFVERMGQVALSPLPGALGGYGGQVTFATDLNGSGNAGAPQPAWASTFLPACGFVASGDTYGPSSAPPEESGSSTKTLTIGLYENGLFKRLRGCMGTFVLIFPAGRPAMIEFTFTGLWDQPTDVALLAPNYPSVAPLRFANTAFSIGSWTPLVEEVRIDIGNEVVLREDPSDLTGYHSAVVTARRVVATLNPEAELVADDEAYTLWTGRTEGEFEIELGGSSANGNRIIINGPKFQVTNVQESDRNGVQIDEVEGQFNRSADAGDDELTLEFT